MFRLTTNDDTVVFQVPCGEGTIRFECYCGSGGAALVVANALRNAHPVLFDTIETEPHVLKSEGDWLRERLHEVQTKMDRAVAEIRDLEKIAKNTSPIPTLQEFGLFRDAVFAAVKRIE